MDWQFWSYSIWIEVAPSCKTVVTGVPDSVDVDPVQPRAQPEHSPVDPHVASPLCMDQYEENSQILILPVQC